MEKQGAKEGAIEMKRRGLHMACWQLAEKITVPIVAAMAREKIRSGRSVAMFMSFTESRLAMSRLMNTSAGFYGGMKTERREYFERQFQADREFCLVNQIKAGGASVSLHDVNGWRPRTAYIWPNYNPVAVQQATGRVDRLGGKSVSEQFIVCLKGEFSEKMVASMRAKIRRIEFLNDGYAEDRF
jgi:urease gamma subunit